MSAEALLAVLAMVWSTVSSAFVSLFVFRKQKGIEAEYQTMQRQVEAELARMAEVQRETGPLRLYMYLSARAYVRWLGTYAGRWKDRPHWPVRTDYETPGVRDEEEFRTAGPLIYRLLRPLTTAGLIVHRSGQSDLALDEPRIVDIVRFHNAAFDILTRQEILEADTVPKGTDLPYDEASAWTRPRGGTGATPYGRVRETGLRAAADALIAVGTPGPDRRSRSHGEFIACWEGTAECGSPSYESFHRDLQPIAAVMHAFSPKRNPVFWYRLVAYGFLCDWYMAQVQRRSPVREEFRPPRFDVPDLLALANPVEARSGGQMLHDFDLRIDHAPHFQRIINDAL